MRYHEELYSAVTLGQPGTWLAKPHRLLSAAVALLAPRHPVVAYDLGAGVGRHTIPLLRALPERSTVYAVDLLPSAVESLATSVPADVRSMLKTRAADLADFEFEEPADLILAFSAIEHLPDLAAIARLLERGRRALNPGGVVAIGVVADRYETDDHGRRRPALLESAITADQAIEVLQSAFDGFEVAEQVSRPARVREERGEEGYTLASTLVTFLAKRAQEKTPRAAALPA